MTLRILSPAAMSDADWPIGSERLRGYVDGFSNAGSSALVKNLATSVSVLVGRNFALPVTTNQEEYENTYVCSPYTTYVSYAKEEMRLLDSRLLRWTLGQAADATGIMLRKARINQMVQVNNWMLSTNLFPKNLRLPVGEITSSVVRNWPDAFICFRSLNHWDNAPLLRDFRQAGYKLIASRQVYIHERLAETWLARSNGRHDRRLLRQTRYLTVLHDELGERDFPRMAELYRLLYTEKYSRHNPMFTAEYLRLCHRTGAMTFLGLREPDGTLDGVLGLFIIDGTVTAPIVGYDTARERKLGLYRLLMTLVFEFALERGFSINLSSGAAGFKRLRGGKPFIEYSAIYDRHLALRRRWALSALVVPVNALGIPLMRRLKL